MQLMAVARQDRDVWRDVKEILYNETVSDYMREPLLDYIYLIPDKEEIKESLFNLTSSPSFIIRQTALAKLTVMLKKTEDCLRLQKTLLHVVKNIPSDLREKREHLYLFKYTALPPSPDIFKPYMESEDFGIREVIYDILGGRDYGVKARNVFDYLCVRILQEKDPDLQKYILNKLLERNYYDGVPLKYFSLFQFLNTNPTEALALRVRNFLESFPFLK